MSVSYWWQLVAIICGTHVHGSKLKFPKKKKIHGGRPLISAGPSRTSIESTWFHIHRLSSIQPRRVLPSASARTAGARLHISVASVMCTCYLFIVRTPLTHFLLVSCTVITVYVRLGQRLGYIDPWRCTARTAHCPPTGLFSGYHPDEFMFELTTAFRALWAREHITWFLNPFCFLLLACWELYIN